MTAEHHTDVDIIERAFGHEVMNVHVFDIDAGTVAQLIDVEVAVERQDATTLAGLDIGSILGTVGLDTSFG